MESWSKCDNWSQTIAKNECASIVHICQYIGLNDKSIVLEVLFLEVFESLLVFLLAWLIITFIHESHFHKTQEITKLWTADNAHAISVLLRH